MPNTLENKGDFDVTPEMRQAGAYVLDDLSDVASGTFAESLAKRVFEEMIAVWLEARSGNDERCPPDLKAAEQSRALARP